MNVVSLPTLPTLRNWISEAVSLLGRLFPGGGESVSPGPEMAIGIRGEACQSEPIPRTRFWKAIERIPGPDLINSIRDGFAGARRLNASQPLNETETRNVILDRVLNSLGYWPWRNDIEKDGQKPDYLHPDLHWGLEAKKYHPNNDDIQAKNPNKKFATIADQIIAYLDTFDLKAVLYSNGRFWWRLERDYHSRQIFALRFNMYLAHSQIVQYNYSKDLEYFVPLFHVEAFQDGNNFALPIRMGLAREIEPHGRIWLKDLNQGFGKVEF